MNTLTKISSVLATALIATSFSVYAGHTNTLLKADLKGKYQVATKEVDKDKKNVGDKNGTGMARVFGIDGDPTTLCYVIEVDKIQLVPVGKGMAAHIHKGKEGVNGPVVANLAGPEDGNAADCLTEGEKGKFPTGELVKNILENPENYYINIHNPKYPNGALRGQLEYQLVEEDDHSHAN